MPASPAPGHLCKWVMPFWRCGRDPGVHPTTCTQGGSHPSPCNSVHPPGTRKKTAHLAFPIPLAGLTQQAGALCLGPGGWCCWGTKPIADLCHPVAGISAKDPACNRCPAILTGSLLAQRFLSRLQLETGWGQRGTGGVARWQVAGDCCVPDTGDLGQQLAARGRTGPPRVSNEY